MSSSNCKNNTNTTTNAESEPNFEWELCRENIRPLKTGRRVEDINRALTTTAAAPKPALIVKEKFDEVMKLYECHSDPIVVCLGFIKWFDEAFPVGRQRLFYEYTWRIVHKLAKEERYKEDTRMLKVWGKLADNSLGNGWSVFQHANTIGSLTTSAVFYVRWAKEFESAGSIAEARKVFRRARRMGAIPIDLLNSEEDQLEMRELRREVDSEANDSWTEDDGELDENGQRVAFTRLQGLGTSMIAPVVRFPDNSRENSVKTQSSREQRTNLNNEACGFEVYSEDNEEESRSQLEMIYEMDTHIEHFQLTENAGHREKLKSGSDKFIRQFSAPCAFTVWEEGTEPSTTSKEGERKKPRLMVKKELREMSFEEGRAAYYEAMLNEETPSLINQPKKLFLTKRDVKPISFEE